MKLLVARFMLAFMLLWLPLQGYAAQSMHACPKHHTHEQLAESSESSAHEGCHGQHMPAHHSTPLAKANMACDDCSSCHLVVQPALMAAPLALALDTVKLPQPAPSVSFRPIFPEQPQRPPLAFVS